MRTTGFIATVLMSALLAGCGARGGGTTPEATFRLWKSAMSERSFADVWEMLSAASRQRMNHDAEVFVDRARKAEGPERTALDNAARLIGMTMDEMKTMDGKALCVAVFKMSAQTGRDDWERLARAEFSRAEVTDGRALVYVKRDGREETDHPMPLVNEGGLWKIDLAAVPVQLVEPPNTPSAAPETPAEKP